MSTKKFDTRSQLRAKLLALWHIPPVHWENKTFSPPRDSGGPLPYLREKLVPVDEALTANDERTGIGFYQLDLFIPVDYSLADAENLADQIKDHFRPAQVIGHIIITRSHVGDGNFDPPWYRIPITIDYRVHQPNLQPS